jgi:hypothetical protein
MTRLVVSGQSVTSLPIKKIHLPFFIFFRFYSRRLVLGQRPLSLDHRLLEWSRVNLEKQITVFSLRFLLPPSGNRLGCNDYRRPAAGVYGKKVRERVVPEPETERQKTAAALGDPKSSLRYLNL